MSKFIPPHPKKGSAEAYAWAEKMQKARAKKKREIRSLGALREAQYFAPGGHITGAALHKKKKALSHREALKAAEALVAHERASLNPRGGPFDEVAAKELYLFATNDADLYRQREVPIWKNLQKKWKKGTYDHKKAVKLWQYWADDAAQLYTKQFGGSGDVWHQIFSPLTRQWVAQERADFVKGEFELGNFMDNPGRPHGKFTRCVESVKKSLRHYHRSGDPKAICGATLNPIPKKKTREQFQVGDEVMLSHDALLRHAKSVPAHAGYTREQFAWRKRLDELEGKPGIISMVFPGSRHVNVTYPDGVIGIDADSLVRIQSNPIAIVGNPPKRVNAAIEGVIYNEVHEIRAEKTKWKPGPYKHPFEGKAQLLGLDNGDILVHSTDGKRLWERN